MVSSEGSFCSMAEISAVGSTCLNHTINIMVRDMLCVSTSGHLNAIAAAVLGEQMSTDASSSVASAYSTRLRLECSLHA